MSIYVYLAAMVVEGAEVVEGAGMGGINAGESKAAAGIILINLVCVPSLNVYVVAMCLCVYMFA
jgi:hypothetical protein